MKRNTIQKTLILDMVKSMKGHVSADEVYEELVQHHPTISRATVYRQLNQLAQDQEIGRVSMLSGADRFDYINKKHYHFKCTKCNEVFDIELDYMDDLENQVKNKQVFEFSGHDIMFKGICQKCKNT